jgi:hypothetical protein
VANIPTDPAKNVTGDSANLIDFMRRLMRVPQSEIKEKLEAEKKAKRTPKRVSLGSDASPNAAR